MALMGIAINLTLYFSRSSATLRYQGDVTLVASAVLNMQLATAKTNLTTSGAASCQATLNFCYIQNPYHWFIAFFLGI